MEAVTAQPLADPLAPPTEADLAPTAFLDSDGAEVRAFVERETAGATDEHEVLSRLFLAVRDGIRYDPHEVPREPDAYRAGAVLQATSSFCIPKSVALSAAARAAGIPSRLGFADVRNHLQTPRLREAMGTDLFAWHGFSLFHVGGRWTKASCAFNAGLCERFGVSPLDFDGRQDALLHPFSGDGSRYMEYVRDRGAYTDLPLATIHAELRAAYPALFDGS